MAELAVGAAPAYSFLVELACWCSQAGVLELLSMPHGTFYVSFPTSLKDQLLGKRLSISYRGLDTYTPQTFDPFAYHICYRILRHSSRRHLQSLTRTIHQKALDHGHEQSKNTPD